MKRFLVVFMVLGLIAGSVATAEAKKRPKRVQRTVEARYNGNWLPFGTRVCDAPSGGIGGCVWIETRATEAFLSAKVTDAHGQPVFVEVVAWSSDSIYPIELGDFCGETDAPISFDPGTTLDLWVGQHVWHPGAAGSCEGTMGTTGTISVTLSNLP